MTTEETKRKALQEIEVLIEGAKRLITEAQVIATNHKVGFTVELGDGGAEFNGYGWSPAAEWYNSNCC